MLGCFCRRSPSATSRAVWSINSFLVIAVYGHTVSATARLREDPSRLDEAFARLAQRVREGALPAGAMAIGDAQGMIRRETFSGNSKAIDPDSNFFLASVTKPIIATSFMQLVEEGRVGLHQPIADFEPRMKTDDHAKVTPWHILTHTSGLSDFDPRDIGRKRPSATDMTNWVIEQPLRFEPGAEWEYVSATFYLLTLIIERVTGMGYVQHLNERLQKPLEMHTTFAPRRAGRPIVAVEGIGVDSFVTRYLVLRYLARAALPGGGLFGGLEDLTRFGAALLRPRIVDGRHVPLRAQTIAEMGEDQLHGEAVADSDGEIRRVHHGLAWGKPTLMRDVPGSKNVFSHGGASGTRLWVDPDAGLVF